MCCKILFQDTSMKSAFGSFTGFKTAPATNSSPFSFLANVSTTSTTTTSITTTTIVNTNKKNIESGNASKAENANKIDDNAKAQTLSSTSLNKKVLSEQGNEKKKTHSSEYYAKLKGLNESVAVWIKTHVDTNPFCILTPIFKDYEKYLKEIKEENAKTEASRATEQTIQTGQNDKKDVGVKKELESPPFSTPSASTTSTLNTGAEWKSEKSIFSNITTNTNSIFGNTEQKTETPKSVFGNTDATPDKSKSIFGNIESNAGNSVFSHTGAEKNPFLRKPTVSDGGKSEEEESKSNAKSIASTFPASTFSFGQSSSTSNVTAGFSFGR